MTPVVDTRVAEPDLGVVEEEPRGLVVVLRVAPRDNASRVVLRISGWDEKGAK